MPGDGLEDSLGFATGLVYRRLSTLLLHRLKEFDITPEQWSVLFYASKSQGLIQRELGERAGKDKPTTTRIVDHLVRKGWVERRPDQADKRAVLIEATPEGRALIERTVPVEKNAMEEAGACLTREERETLLGLLHRLNRHLER